MWSKFYTYIHVLFLVLAAVLFLASIMYLPTDLVDINIHDTYYLFAFVEMLRLLASIFAVEGFIYWVFPKIKRVPNKKLILIHVLLTHGLLLFAVIYQCLAPTNDGFPLYDQALPKQNLHLIVGVLLLLGRLVFMINTIKTLLQKKLVI